LGEGGFLLHADFQVELRVQIDGEPTRPVVALDALALTAEPCLVALRLLKLERHLDPTCVLGRLKLSQRRVLVSRWSDESGHETSSRPVEFELFRPGVAERNWSFDT